MESYVFIDSARRNKTFYPYSNSYQYTLETPLVGVCKAELLSASFCRNTYDLNTVIDIGELKNDRFVANSISRSFAIIPNSSVSLNSNVVYNPASFFPITTSFRNSFMLQNLTISFKDQSGVPVLTNTENSLLLKITHLK
jgi:hypothetical protein